MKNMLSLLTFSLFCFLSPAVSAQNTSLPDFTDLVEKQGIAVVNISTTQVVKSNSSPFPFDESDPAFEFFRRFMPQIPGHGGIPREFQNQSLGSGFIVSADGYILTNAHVVDKADEVTVRLTDKREFKANLVGADKRTDVALLKIDASNLPTVKLGNPAQLKVGEWVVAIGSPFGFDNSVTAGIVSAKGRSLPQESYVPFIQTDVAINPGNSGGPLFNLRGEVIGINSQIYSRSGGYQGVSFAIPIDVAMDIQKQLRSGGKVSRGRLGVVIQEVSKDLAESLGLEKPIGAVINAVEKGGPSDKILEAGDVILKFNQQSVAMSADLPRQVAATRPGTKVLLTLWRKGKLMDISVTVGEVPEEAQAPNKQGSKGVGPTNRLGLRLSELSSAQKQKLQIDYGLQVDEVPDVAGRAELQTGDIILSFIRAGQNTEIKSVAQFDKLLAALPKNSNLTLLIRRAEMQIFVTLKGVP